MPKFSLCRKLTKMRILFDSTRWSCQDTTCSWPQHFWFFGHPLILFWHIQKSCFKKNFHWKRSFLKTKPENNGHFYVHEVSWGWEMAVFRFGFQFHWNFLRIDYVQEWKFSGWDFCFVHPSFYLYLSVCLFISHSVWLFYF